MCCWLIKCIKRIGTAAVNRSDFNDREFFWIKQDRLRRGKETNLLDRLRKSPGAKLIYCEGSLCASSSTTPTYIITFILHSTLLVTILQTLLFANKVKRYVRITM